MRYIVFCDSCFLSLSQIPWAFVFLYVFFSQLLYTLSSSYLQEIGSRVERRCMNNQFFLLTPLGEHCFISFNVDYRGLLLPSGSNLKTWRDFIWYVIEVLLTCRHLTIKSFQQTQQSIYLSLTSCNYLEIRNKFWSFYLSYFYFTLLP